MTCIDIEGFESETIEFTDKLGRNRTIWTGISKGGKYDCYAEINSIGYKSKLTIAMLTQHGPYILSTSEMLFDEYQTSLMDAIETIKKIDVKKYYDEVDKHVAMIDEILGPSIRDLKEGQNKGETE